MELIQILTSVGVSASAALLNTCLRTSMFLEWLIVTSSDGSSAVDISRAYFSSRAASQASLIHRETNYMKHHIATPKIYFCQIIKPNFSTLKVKTHREHILQAL